MVKSKAAIIRSNARSKAKISRDKRLPVSQQQQQQQQQAQNQKDDKGSSSSSSTNVITLTAAQQQQQQQHRQYYQKQTNTGTGQGRRLTEQQKRELEELFYMDGITAWHAHKLTGVSYRAVKKYFLDWGEKLVTDEQYESWIEKQKRVRARALEGLTQQIVNVQTRLSTLQNQYSQITQDIQEIGQGRNKRIITKHRHVSNIDPQLQYGIDDQLRKNTILLEDLKAQAFAIQMMPPAEAIIEQEMEKAIAAKQQG